MALVDNAWYINYGDGSAGAGKKSWFDVTAWATGTAKAAGALVRQNATPAVGSERVFVCIVAGTTHATTEPTWVITRGGKTTDNTVTWQECTGIAALNGDVTNTPSWTITATPPGGVKNTAVTLGEVIKRDSGASYQICSTAGTAGNGAEPAFSNTAGTTTADNTATWTSLGVVGNFTGWQAPHARLANAFTSTWGQAGNSFYLGNNHAETQSSSLILNSPGTVASPCFIYCVNRAGSLPPVSADLRTTATLSTTGNTGLAIANSNSAVNAAYFYGATFNCGTSTNAAVLGIGAANFGHHTIFDSCSLSLVETGNGTINLGVSSEWGYALVLSNTTMAFAAVGQTVNIQSQNIIWKNTASAIVGSVPTSLFTVPQGPPRSILCDGVDLSAAGSGKTLIQNASNPTGLKASLLRCKLGASVTVASTPGHPNQIIDVVQCDSGATNYLDQRYAYQGTQSVETSIIRTGGATDGTTPISWKVVATANSRWIIPFESQTITIWNESTSAITTLTIYGTTTGGGVPNNDDIWVEVEYLGSALTPQGSFITTTKADNLAASAATNNSSDASTWGGSGSGNGFKIVVPSFTPGQKGPINITVKVAKASATYYIDPQPEINGIKVWRSYAVAPGVYANERMIGRAGMQDIDHGISA